MEMAKGRGRPGKVGAVAVPTAAGGKRGGGGARKAAAVAVPAKAPELMPGLNTGRSREITAAP